MALTKPDSDSWTEVLFHDSYHELFFLLPEPADITRCGWHSARRRLLVPQALKDAPSRQEYTFRFD